MEWEMFNINGEMKSALGEISDRKFKVKYGASGRRWLVAIQPNEGDNIYSESLNPESSDGFGGRTIEFKLENGDTISLKGPWFSNSDSLYEDTGYDCRNKHSTYGIIAEERKTDDKGNDLYGNILHRDAGWTLGNFERIKELAQKYADKMGKTIVYAVKSTGGGCSSYVAPAKGEDNERNTSV